MWYIYMMEYYSVIKKNEIMPFAATYRHRDYHTKWNKSERERQIPYVIYKCNLKYDTNECIYKYIHRLSE